MPEIRDMRRRHWFYVDNDLLDNYLPLMGASAFAVYAVLCRMANNDTQNCWPSHATIAARTGLSVNTIRTGLARLAELGLVDVGERLRPDGSRTSNIYTLLEPETDLSKIDRAPSKIDTGAGYKNDTLPSYQNLRTNYPKIELSLDEQEDIPAKPKESPGTSGNGSSPAALWAVIEPDLLRKGGRSAQSLLQGAEAHSMEDGRLVVALASAMTVSYAETRLYQATKEVLKGHPELGVKKLAWVARRNATRGSP